MNIDEIVSTMSSANAYVPGKKIKIEFPDGDTVMLDGVANQVTRDGGPADTTVKISKDDFASLLQRKLDPTGAFMQGKLKVEGDLNNAMQLQNVIPKV